MYFSLENFACSNQRCPQHIYRLCDTETILFQTFLYQNVLCRNRIANIKVWHNYLTVKIIFKTIPFYVHDTPWQVNQIRNFLLKTKCCTINDYSKTSLRLAWASFPQKIYVSMFFNLEKQQSRNVFDGDQLSLTLASVLKSCIYIWGDSMVFTGK